MSFLTVLRTYAETAPESLPASILFKHSEKNITIFDSYPKSIFHFLILPRIKPDGDLNTAALNNLQSLLKADKGKAKNVLASIAEDAKGVKEDIQNEMIKLYGFKWDVWMGFHAVPSMAHLHLHVLSADLCSEKLKHKKHYNSFHPQHGFFLHLDDVISWFDAEPSYFANLVKQFKPKEYEEKLKEDLVCFRCNKEMKNIPTLKAHLQDEWNKMERASRTTAKRKRVIQEAEDPVVEVNNDDKTSSDAATESNPKKVKMQMKETMSS